MNAEYVTVCDQDGDMLGVLENAGEISYHLAHNDLWTASFTLPSSDPKNGLCQAHHLVRLLDGARDTGLYRIIGMPTGEETAQGGVKTYSLEHVMATLLDDLLFGYHEIGGIGVSTSQVIEYILARQTTARWVLGACEFSDQYAYKFENTSLLSALLSLGGVLTEEYTWDFDTTETPWRVSLRHADSAPGCGIHYMRNMVGIEKTMDATMLVTRLYMLGYGEGVNQLTIQDVNSGLPYLQADTASLWGVKSSVFVDTRIEDATTLKARGEAMLAKLKMPYIGYKAMAIDLAYYTGENWDSYMPGKLVRAMDGEHGVDFNARIVSVSKRDVGGRPGEIEITIANAPRDAADSLNTLADRMGISELYSQGATNLYSQQYADNADLSHPAIMRVYVPSRCVRINQMLLSWSIEAFRAYEIGAAAGGGTVQSTSSGGQSTQSSSAGGASERTSSTNGEATIIEPTRVYASTVHVSGALDSQSSEMSHTGLNTNNLGMETEAATGTTGAKAEDITGNSDSLTSGTSNGSTGSSSPTTGGPSTGNTLGPSTSYTGDSTASHAHTVNSHQHWVNGVSAYTTKVAPGTGQSDNTSHSHTLAGHTHGLNAHTHTVSSHTHSLNSHTHTIPSHTHSIPAHSHSLNSHKHAISAHQHGMAHTHAVSASVTIPGVTIDIPSHMHTVSLPEHTHSVSIPAHDHGVTLNDHTHEITFGIFEGGSASNVTVIVDDTPVPAASLTASEMDIVAYLAKDEDGKITRGTWHEIKIVPDALTRIEANLFVQTFVQSVGGGNY